VSQTEPLRGPVTTAWEQELDGDIVGEPLVSGSRLVLEVQGKPGTRDLVVLDLSDGHEITRQTFHTDGPLRPNLWRSTVLLLAKPDRVEAYRIRGRRMERSWRLNMDAPVGSLLLLEREVYVRTAGSISRYLLGRSKPVWSVSGAYMGRLALRGDDVYAVSYDSSGDARLVALSRGQGRRDTSCDVGHHNGEVPEGAQKDRILISVVGTNAIVFHQLGVPLESGARAYTAEVVRRAGPGALTLSQPGYRNLGSEVVGWAGGGLRWRSF